MVQARRARWTRSKEPWPPESEAHEALELLRDGEGTERLLLFARNAFGAGHYGHAIDHLVRGIEYLQGTLIHGPREVILGQRRALQAELWRAATQIGDEDKLELLVALEAGDPRQCAVIASCGAALAKKRKHAQAVRWFARARAAITEPSALHAHIERFGAAELNLLRKVGSPDDVRVAAQRLADAAAQRRAHLDPADPGFKWYEREVASMERASARALKALTRNNDD